MTVVSMWNPPRLLCLNLVPAGGAVSGGGRAPVHHCGPGFAVPFHSLFSLLPYCWRSMTSWSMFLPPYLSCHHRTESFWNKPFLLELLFKSISSQQQKRSEDSLGPCQCKQEPDICQGPSVSQLSPIVSCNYSQKFVPILGQNFTGL